MLRNWHVPIFKVGDAELCDNYRPISLQNSIAKILEKMVATQLVNHLELNNLLYKHQYGFLRGKSTEHNLLHLTNKIGKAQNEGNFVISLFLDLKKAFGVFTWHPPYEIKQIRNCRQITWLVYFLPKK